MEEKINTLMDIKKKKSKVTADYEKETEKSDVPLYEKERSIFKNETIHKIELFRMARSNWVTFKVVSQKMKSSINKGVFESNLYQGRCFCLKKFNFKTTRLRKHYKTLRPLKYYTLKKKLSNTKLFERDDSELEDKVMLNTIISHEVKSNQVDKEIAIYNLEALKPKFRISSTNSSIRPYNKEKKLVESIEINEEIIEREDFYSKLDINNYNSKKNQKKKEKEFKEKSKEKKTCPSKQALNNLKTAKQKTKVLNVCSCDDGKEVTVLIKGFCLCDKMNLNRFKVNKICHQYCKLKLEKATPKPYATDSLELHKRRLSEQSKIDENNKKKIEDSLSSKELLKSVFFRRMKNNIKEKMEGRTNGNESLITLFENKESNKSENALTKEQRNKIKRFF